MTDYNIFSKFYDSAMGDRSKAAGFLRKMVKVNAPKAGSILELACGTGALLKHLRKNYEVSGLDLSEGMLKVAKKELPKAHFYRQSMTEFKLPRKFDVILCVFDSINHLLKFSDWQKTFSSAAKHLNEDGVFIFDMNTKSKLVHHSLETTWVREFDKNYMLMKVIDRGRGVFSWDIKIFERRKDNQYKLWAEDIKEVSFPIRRVVLALKRNFSEVKMVDLKNKKPSEKSDRIYFICKK